MVLLLWDDSQWTSIAIRGHTNMSTLIRIPSEHMRFFPSDKQTDETSIELKPAKWPLELVLIANDMGREVYLDNERIQTIISPAIQTICRLNLRKHPSFHHLSTRDTLHLSGLPRAQHASYLTAPQWAPGYPRRGLPRPNKGRDHTSHLARTTQIPLRTIQTQLKHHKEVTHPH